MKKTLLSILVIIVFSLSAKAQYSFYHNQKSAEITCVSQVVKNSECSGITDDFEKQVKAAYKAKGKLPGIYDVPPQGKSYATKSEAENARSAYIAKFGDKYTKIVLRCK